MGTLALVLAILCVATWCDRERTNGSEEAGALLFLGALAVAIYVAVT